MGDDCLVFSVLIMFDGDMNVGFLRLEDRVVGDCEEHVGGHPGARRRGSLGMGQEAGW